MTSGPPPQEFCEFGFGLWCVEEGKTRKSSVKRVFLHNDDALLKQDDREPELLPPRLDGLDWSQHPSGTTTTTLGDSGHAAEAPERQ